MPSLLTRIAVASLIAIGCAYCARAETATLLVRTDLECRWSIDGESKGVLHVDDRVRVTLELGEHLIEAVPTSGGPRWEKIINLTETKAQVFTIPLLASQDESRRSQDEIRRSAERADTQRRGYWIDPETRLMWAAEGSSPVNWHEAEKYCRQLRIGGYRDWRLPTIEELERLRDPGAAAPKGGVHVMAWVWSGTQGQTRQEALTFWFRFGLRSPKSLDSGADFDPYMVMSVGALCVRRSGE
jgi:hypothetical protein